MDLARLSGPGTRVAIDRKALSRQEEAVYVIRDPDGNRYVATSVSIMGSAEFRRGSWAEFSLWLELTEGSVAWSS